jgi:hypothetical protein
MTHQGARGHSQKIRMPSPVVPFAADSFHRDFHAHPRMETALKEMFTFR